MNFNLAQKWRERQMKRRERKAALARQKELELISRVFAGVRQLMEKGMLIWDPKERRLYVTENLAVVYISRGWEKWANFLANVYQYQMNVLIEERWEAYVISEQNKAIRERKKKAVILPKAEAERIRRAVRAELQPDAVALPKIEAFEFFVLADDKDDLERKAVSFVGRYDPDSEAMVMAPWSEVENAVSQAKENKRKAVDQSKADYLIPGVDDQPEKESSE